MFSRDEEAEARFERLARMTPEGLVFHPYGRARPGYLVDSATVRRLKAYFAFEWLLYTTLTMLALVFFPAWLRSHFFLVGIAVGFLSYLADRLVKLCLLWRSPFAPTRWESDDIALSASPKPSSRLEWACTLSNVGMVALLLVVIAIVTHSIDAWLLAAICAAMAIALAVDVRRSRRTRPSA